jgi:hypothetical protein
MASPCAASLYKAQQAKRRMACAHCYRAWLRIQVATTADAANWRSSFTAQNDPVEGFDDA